MRAVLSIGSNMDDRFSLLETVVDEFRAELLTASSVYKTAPWGVSDQGEFLNAILIVEVDDTALALLKRGQNLEQAAQRVRTVKWGPRTLDVDIVQVIQDGHEVLSDDPVLTLPHPWAFRRAFVLIPWSEVHPEATLRGIKIAELVKRLDPAEVQGVQRVGSLQL